MQKSPKMKKGDTLRIAHYNILKGGKGKLGSILKVLKEINPDICGILEAVNWQNDLEKFKKLCKKIGYHFFALSKANSKYNIVVLSKVPVSVKAIKKDFRHVVPEVVVNAGTFKGTHIYFVHLSPVSEDARLIEIKELLKRVNKFSQSIIMGDFNSLSSTDPYNKEKLLNILQKKKITKYGTNNLRFDVIKKIKSSGLEDAMSYLKLPFTNSAPTPSNRDINHSAKIRIDYSFLSKKSLKHLRKAKIVKNKTTDKASDHYPLFIELTK